MSEMNEKSAREPTSSTGGASTTSNPEPPFPSASSPAAFFATEDELRAAAERGRAQRIAPTLTVLGDEVTELGKDVDDLARRHGEFERAVERRLGRIEAECGLASRRVSR